MSEHANDVVVITGAGRGIGRATALLLAERGAKLVVNDLGCDVEGLHGDPDVIHELVEELRARGGEAVGDASDASHPASLVDLAVRTFGRLDAIVTCAGIRRDRGVLKLDEDDLERALDVGFRGPRRLLQAASAHWVDTRTPGCAVLLAGGAAFFPAARQAASSAAQGALIAMARSAAVELRRHSIRVNVVIPTARTRSTEDLPLFRGIQEGSMLPAHVATLIAYLVGDEGGDIHGEVLGVAGGRIYGLQSRETTGAFVEGRGFTMDEIRSL